MSMRLQAQVTQDFKTICYLSVNLRKSFCDSQMKTTSKKIAHRPVICFFTQTEKERPHLSHVVLMTILFLLGDL